MLCFLFLDQCYPPCENGGSCSPPDPCLGGGTATCLCGGTRYIGQYCEIRMLQMSSYSKEKFGSSFGNILLMEKM